MSNPPSVQIFQIYIKAPAESIWEAITSPSWNARYGYRGPMHYELRPGGRFETHATPEMRQMGMSEIIIDGEVIECDPPRRLVQSYRFLFNDATRAEGFTRVTWEIFETKSGFCRVCITHDVSNAPLMAGMIANNFSEEGGGGWGWILSDLKSLIETGEPMSA